MSLNICAEYVWIDCNNLYRSKTKIVKLKSFKERLNVNSYPKWNYDGSSTQDAKNMEYNEITECQLYPVSVYSDPFRDVDSDVIVWCHTTYLKPNIYKYEKLANISKLNNEQNQENEDNDSEDNSSRDSDEDNGSEDSDEDNESENEDSEQDIGSEHEFDIGLNRLSDLDYIKSMNEYPVNRNMHQSLKLFNTEYKTHKSMFGFEQEFFMINPNTNMPFGFINRNYQNKSSSYFYDIFDS